MPKYYATERAGSVIGGVFDNPGVGGEIEMTEKQAEHPLRIGHISLDPPKKAAKAKPEGQVEPPEA